MELIKEKGSLSTDELCRLLSASPATIRRDITALHGQRLIEKTHGGAMAVTKPSIDDVPLSQRRHTQREEKIRIAAAALDCIGPGETVFLDSGTTTYELAVKLRTRGDLTVLTNDIDIAHELSRNSDNNLIVAGGVRKKSSSALIGVFAEEMLSQLHVDLAFISVDAMSVGSGFMDYNTDEIPIKRLMIRNSRRHIVLCDHTKFDNMAFMRICPLEDMDLVITGKELAGYHVRELDGIGFDIRLV